MSARRFTDSPVPEEAGPAVTTTGTAATDVALVAATGTLRATGARGAAAAMTLQRSVGNRAVQTLSRETPAEAYEAAVAGGRWEQAAQLLGGWGEAGINERVNRLDRDQLLNLMIGASIVVDPHVARIREPVTRRLDALREAEVEQRFLAAIGDARYADAAHELVSMNEARRIPVLRTIPAATLDRLATAIEAEMPGWSDRLYRTVRFVAHGPPEHTVESQFTFATEGTVEHEADVGGGHVRIQTEPIVQAIGHGNRRIEHGYTMHYAGPDALRTRWLQFIWRELEVTHPVRGTYRVAGAIETSGGHYNLTTDPGEPNYNTDARPGSPTPYYEESGGHNRTADATTMWDHPSSMDHLVQEEFRNGATRVVSRAHFNTWLVRDMDVLYRVGLDVQWDYRNRREPPRTQSVPVAGPATALESRMRQRLVEQYPNFDFLP